MQKRWFTHYAPIPSLPAAFQQLSLDFHRLHGKFGIGWKDFALLPALHGSEGQFQEIGDAPRRARKNAPRSFLDSFKSVCC
jgi:hypothetical protein